MSGIRADDHELLSSDDKSCSGSGGRRVAVEIVIIGKGRTNRSKEAQYFF
jgi:hypothetical protein